MKRLALILTTCMYASTALAGGSIFGGGGGGSHNRTKNPNGVSSIGVHVCGSLTCPDVIIRKGDCQGINHASVQYGVCLCDDGYHALKGRCVSNDKCVDVKITDCQTCDPETGEVTDKEDDTVCDYSETGDGFCQSGACVENKCFGIELNECQKSCDPETGDITDKEDDTLCEVSGIKEGGLCRSGECVNPCDISTIDHCTTCVPDHGTATCTACEGGYYETGNTCQECHAPDCQMCEEETGNYIPDPTKEETICTVDGKPGMCHSGTCEKPKPVDCSTDEGACVGCQICDSITKKCVDNQSSCPDGSVCNNGSCTCEDTQKESCGSMCCANNQLCGGMDYTCHTPGSISCTTNEDCHDSTKYCKVEASDCMTFTTETQCVDKAELKPIKWNNRIFYASNEPISWWAAENLCLAHGKKLATLGSLGLSRLYYNDSGNGPLYQAFSKAGLEEPAYFWTSHSTGCYAVAISIDFPQEYVTGIPSRDAKLFVLCE